MVALRQVMGPQAVGGSWLTGDIPVENDFSTRIPQAPAQLIKWLESQTGKNFSEASDLERLPVGIFHQGWR